MNLSEWLMSVFITIMLTAILILAFDEALTQDHANNCPSGAEVMQVQ